MNRTLTYTIPKECAGLRVEQFLKRQGYSQQNITEIKRIGKCRFIRFPSIEMLK